MVGQAAEHRLRLDPSNQGECPASSGPGAIIFAEPARAVADAARLFTSLYYVRSGGRRGGAEAGWFDRGIGLELEHGGSHDSAQWLRAALAGVRAGVRSVAEARFRQRVLKSDLPTPTFNVFLRAADGTDIGEVDAWWAEAGVSVEIDSQEYHFYRDGWLRKDAKRGRLLKHGVFPHNIAPSRVERDWESVCDELGRPSRKVASALASRSWPSTRRVTAAGAPGSWPCGPPGWI